MELPALGLLGGKVPHCTLQPNPSRSSGSGVTSALCTLGHGAAGQPPTPAQPLPNAAAAQGSPSAARFHLCKQKSAKRTHFRTCSKTNAAQVWRDKKVRPTLALPQMRQEIQTAHRTLKSSSKHSQPPQHMEESKWPSMKRPEAAKGTKDSRV